MTYLLDENISWRVANLIQNKFPNCVHVRDIFGDESPMDMTIWNYAKANDMTIITIDNDFNILSKYYNCLPKIIHLHFHNESNLTIANGLIAAADAIEEFIQKENQFLLEIF